jgi:hypothetical protein
MAYKKKRKKTKKIEKVEKNSQDNIDNITTLVGINNDNFVAGEIVEKEVKELSSYESTKEIVKFQPRMTQVNWLNKAMELMTDNISEISSAVGLDRSNWYAWQQEPGFIDWYMSQWNERIKVYGAHLDAIGIKRATKDHKYWRDMQRIAGRLQDTSPGGQTFLQMNVNFIDETD